MSGSMLALAVGEWLRAEGPNKSVCLHLLLSRLHIKKGHGKGVLCLKMKRLHLYLLWQCNPTFPRCQRLSDAHSERRMAVKLAVFEMCPLLSCSPFNLLITQGSHNAMADSRFPSSQFRCRHFRAFLSVISEIVKSVKITEESFSEGQIKMGEEHCERSNLE